MEKYILNITVSENAYTTKSIDYDVSCTHSDGTQSISLTSRQSHIPLDLKEVINKLRANYEPDEVILNIRYVVSFSGIISIDCSRLVKVKKYIVGSEYFSEVISLHKFTCPIVSNIEINIRNTNIAEMVFIQNSSLKSLNFNNVKLENGTLFNNHIKKAKFLSVDFGKLILSSISFDEVSFQECNLVGVTLNNILWPTGYVVTLLGDNKAKKEIYRQIKHVYDSVGNKTEANKFFAKEMEYYEKSLTRSDWDKKLISFLQRYSNNYGNSWLRPFLWIFFISFIYTLIVNCWNFQCSCGGSWSWDCFQSYWLKNVSQFPTELKNAKDWWFLLYAIIMGSLIYQLLVALRRISQR